MNPVKTNEQILVHFPNFGGKRIFPKKSGSVMHNLIWVSSTMLKFRKNQWYHPRKHPDRRKDKRMDGRMDRPYFIELFLLPPGSLLSEDSHCRSRLLTRHYHSNVPEKRSEFFRTATPANVFLWNLFDWTYKKVKTPLLWNFMINIGYSSFRTSEKDLPL